MSDYVWTYLVYAPLSVVLVLSWAMVDGLNTIKAVRFDVNPSPCRVGDDE